jgi:hypothetical protein
MSSNLDANTTTQLLNFRFTHIHTPLTRLTIYLNLPLCWFLTAATLTGHAQQWINNAVVDPTRDDDDKLYIVNSLFLCLGVWTVASHLLLLPLAILWEIWWNPSTFIIRRCEALRIRGRRGG